MFVGRQSNSKFPIPFLGLSRPAVNGPSSVQLVVTVKNKGVKVNQHGFSPRLDFENSLVEELVGPFLVTW